MDRQQQREIWQAPPGSIYLDRAAPGRTQPGDTSEHVVCLAGTHRLAYGSDREITLSRSWMDLVIDTHQRGLLGQDVPLRIGHADASEEAAGWVRSLSRDGDRMLAEIEWSRRGIDAVRDRRAKRRLRRLVEGPLDRPGRRSAGFILQPAAGRTPREVGLVGDPEAIGVGEDRLQQGARLTQGRSLSRQDQIPQDDGDLTLVGATQPARDRQSVQGGGELLGAAALGQDRLEPLQQLGQGGVSRLGHDRLEPGRGAVDRLPERVDREADEPPL